MNTRWIAALALSLVIGASSARAEAPDGAPLPPVTRVRTYGLQIALADSVVIAGGLAAKNLELLIGGYLLTGPVLHLAHGNRGRALASLGLRVALPLLAFAAAGQDCESYTDAGGDSQSCIGDTLGLLGVVAAISIDAVFLARKTTVAAPRMPVQVGGVAATPTLGTTRHGGLTVGFSATF